ncbi:TIGR03560 family F420-dependent LLM class oxidoreductase [Actinobacteria bacterium YIM 96077]|uniref:LLM class F420-dependent oxidoreductase n=1 Tax=Phytoactinopolyspora halophila TaxID=1981511 RepID=A0A329QL60_9ACTN|nr:TIGR03560 family F420-dependent LLM class oxidoreductase [Actinobacteria bacterium YIM 96077]RAW13074.1 LLM class F420-dependent oxidoreductase [Phytoactinopolyspora halophila]
MRFGMFVPQGWRLDLVDIPPSEQWSVMRRVAQHADQGSQFESIWVYDHFHTTPVPTEEATHEAWTLMAALGAETQRVRLGQMCTCMAYRNPAYLGKVAATVDIVSGGRTEMGIGGGWYEHEWRAYGYGFPSAGDRLGMLDEGIQIMRQLWTHGAATLDGKHYSIDGAICRPLPLQDGGIPLWVAGGGEKVTLRIAAKHARGGEMDAESYTGYTNFGGSNVDVFTHKSKVLAQHCRELGTDFDSITRSANHNIVIGETEAEVKDKLAQLESVLRRHVPEERVQQIIQSFRDSPMTGTPEQLVEQLRKLYDAGMTYAICYFHDAAYDLGSVELFEREVIPALR